jgi:TPR repeat protein
MKLKYMLAAGAILFSCNTSAQTSAGIKAYNGGGLHWGGHYQPYVFRGLNSPAEVVESERGAAERGDASAQFKLALRYDVGQGVPQDYAEAVKWLRRAADQDFVKAQYNLGCMYDSGQGVSQDHAEAAKWFRKAAEHGYARAQKNLGAKYGRGQGVPQSHTEAYVWSSIAVISGDEGAINNRDFAASKLSTEDVEAALKRAGELYEEIQQRQG